MVPMRAVIICETLRTLWTAAGARILRQFVGQTILPPPCLQGRQAAVYPPLAYGAVIIGRVEAAAIGGKEHLKHRALRTDQAPDRGPFLHVPQQDHTVQAALARQGAIRAEGESECNIPRIRKERNLRTGRHILQYQTPVLAAGERQAPIGTEDHILH